MKKFLSGAVLGVLVLAGVVLLGQSSVYNLGPIQFQYDGSHVFATTPIVARVDLTAQQASIAQTPLYTVPAGQGGFYRFSAFSVITQPATTSSTLPQVGAYYTEADSNASEGLVTALNASSGNTLGTTGVTAPGIGQLILNVKAGTVISYGTAGYVSSGATPMQYSVHIKLEYLGN